MNRIKSEWFEDEHGRKINLSVTLQQVADSIVYNLQNDWDYVILVSGDRRVRTGKSVLGMNLGAYINGRINQMYNKTNTFDHKNIYFSSEKLIEEAEKKPSNSVIVYDEASDSLVTNKNMTKLQNNMLQFLDECGQLNHVFILVLPDFFTMKEQVAVARSECLINVWVEGDRIEKDIYNVGEKTKLVKFRRGFFHFYNREAKKNLYDKARAIKIKDYRIIKATGHGVFQNNYPFDQEKYRELKRQALLSLKERLNPSKPEEKDNKTTRLKNYALWYLKNKYNISGAEIQRQFQRLGLSVDQRTVQSGISLGNDQINAYLKTLADIPE